MNRRNFFQACAALATASALPSLPALPRPAIVAIRGRMEIEIVGHARFAGATISIDRVYCLITLDLADGSQEQHRLDEGRSPMWDQLLSLDVCPSAAREILGLPG